MSDRYRSSEESITVEELWSILDYDKSTGLFIWRERADRDLKWNVRYATQVAGTIGENGRRYISINKILYLSSRLAWFYTFGIWPDIDLDHRNTNPLDDRIWNLRKATFSQNNTNTNVRSDNKSGYKGVSWHNGAKKWRATIKTNGSYIHLGFFFDPKLAADAYRDAAIRFFGEFART